MRSYEHRSPKQCSNGWRGVSYKRGKRIRDCRERSEQRTERRQRKDTLTVSST